MITPHHLQLLHRPAAVRPYPLVLYFHHVGKARAHYTSIDQDEFERALDLAATFGRLALPDEASWSGDGREMPILVTFDDGYRETINVVMPIMERLGARGVFFLNTANVAQSAHLPALGDTVHFADWDAARVCAAAGHAIGSHGHHHWSWTQLNPAAIEAEVDTSLHQIEFQLGRRAWGLAYPFGHRPARPVSATRGIHCYGTIRERATHWRCNPAGVRRVFLPARERRLWPQLFESWRRAWFEQPCPLCRDPDGR